MEQYIPKSALVAEIERRKNQFMSQADSFHKLGMEEKRDYYAKLASNMYSILSFIDTFQVKEVELEKETKKWWKEHLHLNPENKLWMDAHQSVVFAKHFFKLGLKAQKGK